MVAGVLQIGSYVSLGVVVALLLLRALWPRLAPRVDGRRFRRRLGAAEQVLASWTEELRAQEEGRRHEQRDPETTEDS